jgi:hypothetical protein
MDSNRSNAVDSLADEKESVPPLNDSNDERIQGIRFVDYVDESQLDYVMSLVGRDLSEPYSSKYQKRVTWTEWNLTSVELILILFDMDQFETTVECGHLPRSETSFSHLGYHLYLCYC